MHQYRHHRVPHLEVPKSCRYTVVYFVPPLGMIDSVHIAKVNQYGKINSLLQKGLSYRNRYHHIFPSLLKCSGASFRARRISDSKSNLLHLSPACRENPWSCLCQRAWMTNPCKRYVHSCPKVNELSSVSFWQFYKIELVMSTVSFRMKEWILKGKMIRALTCSARLR